MSKLVAIDGGGTKTDFVLFDETGRVQSRVLAVGCNPNDFGWQHTRRVLTEGLERLLGPLGGLAAPVDALFAGVSGGTVGGNREQLHALLRELLPAAARIGNDSDAVSALSSGIGCKDGCVVIAGTGSVGFVRRAGRVYRVGGWGYLFDKGGSGYDFGRDAVTRALCAADGRAGPTLLTPLLEQKLGMPVERAVAALYQQGKPAVAALAPLVFEAERQGDEAAKAILAENAAELARLFNTLAAQLPQTPCQTVLAGSIFKDWPQLKPYVTPLLQREHLFVFPKLPPVYGSALEALRLAEVKAGKGFEARFAAGLNAAGAEKQAGEAAQ